MNKDIINPKELLLVFLLGFVTSIANALILCVNSLNLANFDLQTIVTWSYASFRGILPYKDIFYPYGILSFYQNANTLFYILNLLILPTLLILIFFFFKTVFKEKRNEYAYASWLFLYVFIITLIGVDVFNRYGVLVIGTLFFGYRLYKNNNPSKTFFFSSGILCSIVFTLWIDQGVYCFLTFIFLYFANAFALIKRNLFVKKAFSGAIKNLGIFALGALTGILPFLYYLLANSMLIDFIRAFFRLSEIALFAKTPFFSYLLEPDNMFTISVLIFSIGYLTYLLLLKNKKFNIINFIQFGLVFDLLLFEQKGIIRSVSSLITFVSYLLLIFLIFDLLPYLKKIKTNKPFLFCVILLFPLFYLNTKNINHFKLPNIQSATLNGKVCFNRNLNLFIVQNPTYVKTVDTIKRYKNFNGKIVSYPGDPLFYVLLGQKLPYYTSIYEASSITGQNSFINYIQKNGVNYVVINTGNLSIQDGVPNYVRSPYELRYILENYEIKDKIGEFLILNKKTGNDFFNQAKLNLIPDYEKYLLNINLGMIPYSEGLYKYAQIKTNGQLINTDNLNQQSEGLKNKPISSKDKIIVLTSPASYKKNTVNSITISTVHKLSTTISFNACKKNMPCIINLSNIPLFYKNRQIVKIQFNGGFKGNIAIFNLKDLGNLW